MAARVSGTEKATRAIDAAKAGASERKKGGHQPGAPKTGGRQKGTPNKGPSVLKVDPMTENLNTILGAIVDELPEEVFQALTPLDVLTLCQRVALRAHCFHMTVAVAEKTAPYKHARVVAAQPEMVTERRVVIEGGIGEIKPMPIPVDPSFHEGTDAIN